MAIDNLPLFSAMNREEVKPCFPNPPRPLTSQEAHFAIMEKVNVCINEVNNFEQRVHQEMESFCMKSEAENTGFKEAIQASYNTFMVTVQNEINNFEQSFQNNFDLYRNDIDKRVSDFETAINTEFNTLQENVVKASDGKIAEMEKLKVDLNRLFNDFKATVNEIVNNFKTQVTGHMEEQDGKIEEYRQYMVDNLLPNTRKIFEQKAENGEITVIMKEVYGDERKFKGSLTYEEIHAIEEAENGDYYFCSTDEHYYQRTETAWVDVGSGEKIINDYEAYKLNTEKRFLNNEKYTDSVYLNLFKNTNIPDECYVEREIEENYILHNDGNPLQTDEGVINFYITEKIPVTAGEIILVSCTWNGWFSGYAFYDLEENVIAKRGYLDGYPINDSVHTDARALKNFPVVVPEGATHIRLQGEKTRMKATIARNFSIFTKDFEVTKSFNNLISAIGRGNLLSGEEVTLELLPNKVIQTFGYVDTLDQSGDFVVSTHTEIEEGQLYAISCGSQSEFLAYAFYDENKNYISGLQSKKNGETDSIGTISVKDCIVAPFGAKYIIVAGKKSREEVYLKKITALKGATADASGNPLQWEGKTWVAFGDSITECNYRTTKNYHKYISDETGITVLNHGVSGSGYARSAWAFHKRIGDLSDVDFDVITFFGSGNDLGGDIPLGTASDTDTNTIGGCINNTLDGLFAIKPLARIGIISPSPWRNNTPENNGSMAEYSDLLKEIAEKRSIPFLDLFRKSNLNPNSDEHNRAFYSCEQSPNGDGVHPNAEGHARIAPMIREFLKTLI